MLTPALSVPLLLKFSVARHYISVGYRINRGSFAILET